ncbi:hypothetical protein J4D99_02660 [Siccationidurans ginsengisoli]|uniref:hypothetical protein n=1 Tax=Hymenobacter ginsengisoli TaxID=1051626 RepID=UPI001ACAC7B1|nr:hypothetical protein [Hymenobacter sp. BT559]
MVAGLLLATAAPPQTVPTSPARQRAEARRALREAGRADVPYKDSHLEVSRRQLRRGTSERLAPVAGEPRFGPDGKPRVARARLRGLRRWPKTEPKP